MLGLGPARVARQAAGLAQRVEVAGAAGEHLVDVGLVAGVPQEDVARRVEHPVQGERELDGAEVGAEVAVAGALDGVDDELAELLGQLVQLRSGERPEVGRTGDRVEEHG